MSSRSIHPVRYVSLNACVLLMAFLFGDIFAITAADLRWIYLGGAAALALAVDALLGVIERGIAQRKRGRVWVALGVLAAALFIAGVLVGADSMSRAIGVPTYLADVIVAVSLLSVLVASLMAQYRVRRS